MLLLSLSYNFSHECAMPPINEIKFVLQESGDTSDQSGESNISDREHMSLLQNHLKHIEKKLFEDITRLIARMDHLERRYDSMQTQIRMLHSDRYRNQDVIFPPKHRACCS